ncbi:MAG TPA: hypothetical protein VK939_11460 [Longimicrobiales bacterium]|nr:hypothetical protein [Longimicrobiales bacterium]
MKRKRALELQQAWGGEPCHHPAFAKEYDMGQRTGNFVCTRCGAILSPLEKVRLTKARESAEPPPEQASLKPPPRD